MNFNRQLNDLQEKINEALNLRLPAVDTRPSRLHEAIRHSVSAGGKRIRPVLVLSANQLFPSGNNPMPAAIAIECIHTYSLIHDDLPAMDNSDLRRGQPACHKAFDEATAILAGDALLAMAFEVLSVDYADRPEIVSHLVRILATAAGSERLVGGQMEDLLAEGSSPNADTLRYVHANKTGALLTACLEMGLCLGNKGAEEKVLILGRRLGMSLGLAFQAMDDLLDATRTTEELGKDAESDAIQGKATSVAFRGIEETKEQAKHHTEEALSFAREIGGDNEFLLELIVYLLNRKK
ncbi:MAG: polyprenyl synthetase family protein [Opitutae bacterium]|nr:polyprenyl synthetase family protein [Opitutae bacterium]MBT6850559.1 polyprenyl synthetase family protein [Opitutae bacterium]